MRSEAVTRTMFATIFAVGVTLVAGSLAAGCGDDDGGGGNNNTNENVAPPNCGDGVLDSDEACDGTQLDGQTCVDHGFTAGDLHCTAWCAFDTADCSHAGCGDGLIEGAEECDGTNLGDQTCESHGYLGGDLGCTVGCVYTTVDCIQSICGNGVREGGEACDGDDVGTADCTSIGHDWGELDCLSDCTFDDSGCFDATCGNDLIEPSETCEGTDLDGQDCLTLGYTQGALVCGPSCIFDVSDCCSDLVAGGPIIVSPTTVEFPPGSIFGTYLLTFNEWTEGVDAGVTWQGDGTLDAVVQVDPFTWSVEFWDLPATASATLIVGYGVTDDCGDPIDGTTLISIHVEPDPGPQPLLTADFETDPFAAGWSTTDLVGTGNVWAPNDIFGVVNQTDGTGLSLAAESEGACNWLGWDTELYAPVVDLTGFSGGVLTFENSFIDYAGNGQAWVSASADGLTWTDLIYWTGDHGPTFETVELTAFAGGPVHLRWRYSDDNYGCAKYWHIDDVLVEGMTQFACACPASGVTELLDVTDGADGNGSLSQAEPTGALLLPGDRVNVCGLLQDESTSGFDYFEISTGGNFNDTYLATVTYCTDQALHPATIELRNAQNITQASASSTGHGSFSVQVSGDSDYYIVLHENLGNYPNTDYLVSVRID